MRLATALTDYRSFNQTAVVRELREVLGDKAVSSSSEEIVRLMRDESWLSPVLQREIERRTKEEGAGLGVQAVVRPTSLDFHGRESP